MRNMLALFGLLVIGFAGLGWYCGWYKLNVSKNQGGNIQIQTEVDTNKVADDSSAFFLKVGQVIGERAEKARKPASGPVGTPGPVSSPANTPNDPNAFQGGWIASPEKASRPGTGNR